MAAKNANTLRKEARTRSRQGAAEIRKNMKNQKAESFTGIREHKGVFMPMYQNTPLGMYDSLEEAEARMAEYLEEQAGK